MSDIDNERWPLVSVVLPVRNEGQFIRETISYLQQQNYPGEKLEIIVVDGRSSDDTRDIVSGIAKEDRRVKLLDNPRTLSSSARNIGAKSASGEIIIFVDGHVYIDNKLLLQNTVELMRGRQVSVLSRPQLLDTPRNTFFQKAVSCARKSVIGHGLDSTIYTLGERYVNPSSSGASYHRDVFERVGYYDEDFDASEDVEFNLRVHLAGFKSYTSPKLGVFYYPRRSLGALFKQMVRYGTGRFRLLRKYPGGGSIAGLAPTLLLIGLALLLVSAPLITVYPLAILAGTYVFGLMFFTLTISFKEDIRFFWVLPLIFAVIHLGLGWGFLREMLVFLVRKSRSAKKPS